MITQNSYAHSRLGSGGWASLAQIHSCFTCGADELRTSVVSPCPFDGNHASDHTGETASLVVNRCADPPNPRCQSARASCIATFPDVLQVSTNGGFLVLCQELRCEYLVNFLIRQRGKDGACAGTVQQRAGATGRIAAAENVLTFYGFDAESFAAALNQEGGQFPGLPGKLFESSRDPAPMLPGGSCQPTAQLPGQRNTGQ